MTYAQLRRGMFVQSSLTHSVYRISAVFSLYADEVCVAKMKRILCGNIRENTIGPSVPERTFHLFSSELPIFNPIDEFEVQLLQLDISQK